MTVTPERKSKMTMEQAAYWVCKVWAESRSKDPATKVGACIIDPRTGSLCLGYNGFPVGVPDEEVTWQNRVDEFEKTGNYSLTKYDLVIHAEVNAARKALMSGVDLTKATLVCTHLPCPQCFKDVVLANGIRRVVYGTSDYASMTPRNIWLVKDLARGWAGFDVQLVELPKGGAQ